MVNAVVANYLVETLVEHLVNGAVVSCLVEMLVEFVVGATLE